MDGSVGHFTDELASETRYQMSPGSSGFKSCTSVWLGAVRFSCCLLTPCRSAILGHSCRNHDSGGGVVSPSRRSCKDTCLRRNPAALPITTEMILVCCFCWIMDPDGCLCGVHAPCPPPPPPLCTGNSCLRMKNNSEFLHG